MMRTFVAIAEPSDDGKTWWISFPSLPGITSAADGPTEIAVQARDALESAAAAGLELRGSVEEAGVPAFELADYKNPLMVLVPFEEPAFA